jgi:hypothetical protein
MRSIDWLACRTVAKAGVIAFLVAGCDSVKEPAGPGSPEPPGEAVQDFRLEARSDTTFTGVVGIGTAHPVVRLTLDGNPAPGREVQFLLTGGGSIAGGSVRTDTAGLASVGTWTLGTAAGRQTLTVRAAGANDVVFAAQAQAGSPETIDIVAGNHQTAPAGAPLPAPLQVKLADHYGNPVPGLTVSYAVDVGTGSVPDTSVTDSLGIASSGIWTLGGAGPQRVSSSFSGRKVYFDAFACGDPCRGRDLLFVAGHQLLSLVNGVATSLYTAPSGSYPTSPAWSPDGRKIAFVIEDFVEGEVSSVGLYLMDADGSDVVLRADRFYNPSWSPDGHRLAVNGPVGLYTLSVDEDGSPPLLVADHGWAPAWSPDGTKIAYVGESSLNVMNSDGSAGAILLRTEPDWITRPSWSPDGQRLAFTRCDASDLSEDRTCKVFTVSAAGTDLKQLTTEGFAYEAVWSPDGSRIAVDLSLSGVGLAWVLSDGSSTQPIPMGVVGSYPAWRP